MELTTAAEIAAICSAVIAFISLLYDALRPKGTSGRRRSFRLNRKEILLILCILLFLGLGLAIPQVIIPLFVAVFIIIWKTTRRSEKKRDYVLSLLTATLAGLIGAYISAFPAITEAGLPVFYSRTFRFLDIWYLLN